MSTTARSFNAETYVRRRPREIVARRHGRFTASSSRDNGGESKLRWSRRDAFASWNGHDWDLLSGPTLA